MAKATAMANYYGTQQQQQQTASFDWPKVLGLGGSLLSTYGNFMQYQSMSRSYAGSARAVKLEAEELALKGEYESLMHRLRGREYLSMLEGGYSALGLELRGTPVEVLTKTAEQLEMDRLMIERNYAIEEQKARAAAKDYEKMAKKSKSGGMMSSAAGIMGAVAAFFV